MQIEDKLEYVLEIASKLELDVRAERLGGSGGGLCKLKGKLILFVDIDAEPIRRYETLLSSIMRFELDDIYILPEIRSDMEKIGKKE